MNINDLTQPQIDPCCQGLPLPGPTPAELRQYLLAKNEEITRQYELGERKFWAGFASGLLVAGLGVAGGLMFRFLVFP